MSSDVNDGNDDERTDPHIALPKSQPAPAPSRVSSPPPISSKPLATSTTTIGAAPKFPVRSISAGLPPKAADTIVSGPRPRTTPAEIDATRMTDPARPPVLPARPTNPVPSAASPAADRASEVPPTSSLTAAMLIPRPSSVHPPPMAGAARVSDPGGDPLRERLAQFEVSSAATRSIATRVEAETTRAHARLDAVAGTIETQVRERVAQLEATLEATKRTLEARVEQMFASRPTVPEDSTDLGALKTALATLRQQIGEHDRQFEARRARVESLETRVATVEQDARLVEVRRAMESFDLRIVAIERAQEALRADIDTRLRAIEARVSEGPTTGTRKAAAPEPELRRIKGVGPKYEKALRDVGITTIAQVAAMTDDDVARVAAQLSVPVERVRKLGWPEIARGLLSE